MGARTTKELYLSISGGIDSSLLTASKAGRSALLEIGNAANDIEAEVKKAFEKMGSDAEPSAKTIEASYKKTFDAIRQNARDVLAQPTQGGALAVLNAGAAEKQAAAAEQQAAALRTVATAASAVAQRAGEAGAAERVLAVAAAANAEQAEREAVALRNQANVLGAVRGELTSMGIAHESVEHTSTRASLAQMEMMHVVRASSDAFAAGAPITQIFSMEIGRVAEAAAMSGPDGALGRYAKFLTGGWVMALQLGLAVGVPFVEKLIEGGNALKKETEELKSNAEKAEVAEQAKQAFASTEAGAIAGVRKLTEEIERQNDALKTNSERMFEAARKNLNKFEQDRPAAAKEAYDARVALRNLPPSSDPDASAAAFSKAKERSDVADAALATIDKGIADATTAITAAKIAFAGEASDRASNPVEAIRFKYHADAAFGGLLAKAEERAKLENWTVDRLTAQLALLKEQEKAEIDAAEKAKKAGSAKAPALGSEVTADHGAALFASAQSYRGLSETRDNTALRSLFGQANIHVDPKMTAWCAAFVNAVLATNGLPGTSSLAARSFLGYGTATSRPEQGDIVVSKRTGGGHVGFYQGTDAKGNVLVLGGNTGNQVATETVARGDVLGFRRAPDAAAVFKTEQAAADDLLKSLEKIRDAQFKDLVGYDPAEDRRKRDRQAAEQLGHPSDELKQLLADFDKERDGRIEAVNDVLVKESTKREDGIRSAASLYKELFTGGVGGIWDKFKERGLEAIAELLAKWTIGKLGKTGVDGEVGGLLSLFGFADGLVPGFATGRVSADGVISGPGSGTSDSIYGWLAGRGLIKVSDGESIMTARATAKFGPTLRAMNDDTLPGFATGMVPANLALPAMPSAQAMGRGGSPLHFDLRGAVVTADLLTQMQTMAAQSGGQAYLAAVNHTDDSLRQLSRVSL